MGVVVLNSIINENPISNLWSTPIQVDLLCFSCTDWTHWIGVLVGQRWRGRTWLNEWSYCILHTRRWHKARYEFMVEPHRNLVHGRKIMKIDFVHNFITNWNWKFYAKSLLFSGEPKWFIFANSQWNYHIFM